MSLTVFDLQAIIGLDSSSFETKLKALGIKVAEFGLKFAKESMQVGMEFDKSMSQVAATLGKTSEDINKEVLTVNGFTGSLRDFAQKMGETTKFTASEAAEALNYMALAGYNAEESMQMLPNVLNLAAAGDFDLARASDMVTDATTAFGLSVQENGDRIVKMVDEMAKAASTGNTTVEMLGDAFLVVGGLAKELNGGLVTLEDGTQASTDGIQELEIALTAMANAGVKGSEAGTHMRNMLLKLSSPTDQGTIALENMGVAIFDTEGKMRSLHEIFGDLNEAMSTMTQQERIQTISDLFNTRDMASAEALLSAVSQDWDKIGGSILKAKGAADKMSKEQLNNLAGDITIFKSAWEGMQIAFSDNLKNPFREIVQYATEGVGRLTEAIKTGDWVKVIETASDWLTETAQIIADKIPPLIEKLKPALEALVKAIGEVLITLIPIIVPTMLEIGKALLEALFKGLGEIEGWGPVLQGVFVALFAGKAFTALSAFSDKIGSVVSGLKKMSETKFNFSGAEGTAATGGNGTVQKSGGLIKTLGTDVTKVGAKANVLGAASGFFIGSEIGSAISDKLYESGVYGEDSGGVLEDYASKGGIGKWLDIFGYIGKGIEDATVGTQQAIDSYNNKTKHALEMGYSSWEEYNKAMNEKFDQMQAAAQSHFDAEIDDVTKFAHNLNEAFNSLGEGAGETVVTLADGAEVQVKVLTNTLQDILTKGTATVKTASGEMKTYTLQNYGELVEAIKDTLGEVPESMQKIFDKGNEIANGSFETFSEIMTNHISETSYTALQEITQFTDGTEVKLSELPDALEEILQRGSAAVTTTTGAIKEVGVDNFGEMVDMIKASTGDLPDWLEALLSEAESRLAKIKWNLEHYNAETLQKYNSSDRSDVEREKFYRKYASAVNNPVIFDHPEYAMVGDGTEPEILMGISTFRAMLEQAQSTIQAQVGITPASGTSDNQQERQIIIPVYIGDEKLDEIVVESVRRQAYLTGGR